MWDTLGRMTDVHDGRYSVNLWYVIADANGYASITAGQVITIPPKPNTVTNGANFYTPYDPTKAVGNTTPQLPLYPGHENIFAEIASAIVTILIIVMSDGAAAPQADAIGGTIAEGSEAAAAQEALSASASFVGPLPPMQAMVQQIATKMVVGAFANMAGQIVNIAGGNQDDLDFSGVAMGAIGAGVSAGLGYTDTFGGPTASAVIARTVVGNALTQGIGVATGLQHSFDWTSVAGSFIGAGIGQAVQGEFFGNTSTPESRFASGAATALATAAAGGGRRAAIQGFADAIGNMQGGTYSIGNDTQASIPQETVPLQWPLNVQPGQQGSGTYLQKETEQELDALIQPDEPIADVPNASPSSFSVDRANRYMMQTPEMLQAWQDQQRRLAQAPAVAPARNADVEQTLYVPGSYGGRLDYWRITSPEMQLDDGRVQLQGMEHVQHRGLLALADDGLQRGLDAADEIFQQRRDEGNDAYQSKDYITAGMRALQYGGDKIFTDLTKFAINLPKLATSNTALPNMVVAAAHPWDTAKAGYNSFVNAPLQDQVVGVIELAGPAALKLGSMAAGTRIGEFAATTTVSDAMQTARSRVIGGGSVEAVQSGGRQVLNPNRVEGWDAADKAYEAIRSNQSDISTISRNTASRRRPSRESRRMCSRMNTCWTAGCGDLTLT